MLQSGDVFAPMCKMLKLTRHIYDFMEDKVLKIIRLKRVFVFCELFVIFFEC
ncbi:hypothetical protein MSP8886_02048 [Marinomonas spartinae]|uniref:Uncharacterized protein n=1 Tax=Marinomonas spartinae TaxID=1792290 RepID=A0A1A8TGW8_9GAMM|nr:hypothetical protein MSP8886_02048 [Marinomonas spartinae]